MMRFVSIATLAAAIFNLVLPVDGGEPATSVAKVTQNGLSDNDWPVFLGPHGTGVAGGTGTIEPWSANAPPVLWTKQIGTGYSAPSVRGGKLVVHHRLKKSEIVGCLNAESGNAIWTFEYPSDFRDPYGYNNGPRCSPLLTENRCYTFGAEGKLVCL